MSTPLTRQKSVELTLDRSRVVDVEPVVERLQADLQQRRPSSSCRPRSARASPGSAAARPPRSACRRGSRGCVPSRSSTTPERQRVDADVVRRQDEGALHHVLQLAHVARPAVRPQAIERGLGEGSSAAFLRCSRFSSSRKCSASSTTSSSRSRSGGSVDREDVQTIAQVLAQLAVRHRLLRRAVAGGDHAHVDLHRLVGAHAQHLARSRARAAASPAGRPASP